MIPKEIRLKKRLIREAIIFSVATLFVVGIAFYVSGYDDDAQAQKLAKSNENSDMTAQRDAIRTAFGQGFAVSQYFDAYIKNHKNDFTLDRESATLLLSSLRTNNHLVHLGVTIAPLADMPADGLQLKTSTLVKSDISLTISAVTDTSIYNFIEQVERQLPGFMQMHDVKIVRSGELTQAMLMDMKQHRLTPLVSADLAFSWVGMRPRPADKNSMPALGPPPGGVHP